MKISPGVQRSSRKEQLPSENTESQQVPVPVLRRLRELGINSPFDDSSKLLYFSSKDLTKALLSRGYKEAPGKSRLYAQVPGTMVYEVVKADAKGPAGQLIAFVANEKGQLTAVEIQTFDTKFIHTAQIDRDDGGRIRRVMGELVYR